MCFYITLLTSEDLPQTGLDFLSPLFQPFVVISYFVHKTSNEFQDAKFQCVSAFFSGKNLLHAITSDVLQAPVVSCIVP